MGNSVRMVPPEGGAAVEVPAEKVQAFVDLDYTPETTAARASKNVEAGREEYYTTPANTVKAGLAGAARGISGGASDVLVRAVGGEEARRELAGLREHNQTLSTVTEIGGSLLPVGIGGVASRAATSLAGKGGGIVRTAIRTGTEGAIMGVGSGVSELALSDDPLTLERAASVIKSHAVFGAVTGGAVGAGGKILEKGLVRAKTALDDAVAASSKRAGIADDLAVLDRKGLRAAEKAELDAIEAARVPKRGELADEIKSLRSEMKEQKLWLATKDADVKAFKEVREVGKTALEADKAIDRMLRNPKALAERPQRVLDGLQQQEHALERLVAQGDNLKPIFAKDATGVRQAAFDYASVALEKNRALQAKIGELTAKPTSQRLGQIADATDALSMPKQATAGGLAQDMLGGSVFGHVAGAFSGLPIVGPMIGAKVAKVASDLVGGKLGGAAAEAAARGSKAISTFLDVGRKIAPAAPVLATKVLSSVAFAPGKRERRADKVKAHTLTSAFKARSEEIRSHIEIGPDGTSQMRASSRAAIAERLAPIAAVNPLLADRIETTKALAVEFLASKLPRRPDVGGIPVGPDKWQPSDMEMRTWARYVAAVEDPHGVVERLAAGSVTPEDAEAMRTVYPEMHADITRSIVEQLGTLRQSLPYQRRLALSMFSGVAVDPALDPRVLRILQGSFEQEEGTEQGTEAPRAQPQFGSISKQQGTPAQERSQ